ncbi:MAG: archaemetzincin [Gammaproteobacteria bacterium]|nr:archaemetzincin [Gammaproteobacteria bacterium]
MVSDVLVSGLSEQLRDLHIIPFDTVRSDIIQGLAEDLDDCGFRVSIESSHSPPSMAFNQQKQKYLADEMLDYLRCEAGGRVLGVVSDDICRYVLNSIKGTADFVGRAAVISLCQLDKAGMQEMLRRRMCKLALHELGHTFGFAHCSDQNCVMHDAPSLKLWDIATDEFCSCCARWFETNPYRKFLFNTQTESGECGALMPAK